MQFVPVFVWVLQNELWPQTTLLPALRCHTPDWPLRLLVCELCFVEFFVISGYLNKQRKLDINLYIHSVKYRDLKWLLLSYCSFNKALNKFKKELQR